MYMSLALSVLEMVCISLGLNVDGCATNKNSTIMHFSQSVLAHIKAAVHSLSLIEKYESLKKKAFSVLQ
ncbi:hypothetical protein R84981_002862 [Carnimonas sp. R-84981]